MKADSLLLRQVHPTFILNEQLTSQAFFPFPKDKGQLSVYDGDMVTPEESFVHFTKDLNLASVGAWGVTNAEVVMVGLTSRSDSLPLSPAHALIDFGTAPEKECRKLSKKLKGFAVSRGRLYP